MTAVTATILVLTTVILLSTGKDDNEGEKSWPITLNRLCNLLILLFIYSEESINKHIPSPLSNAPQLCKLSDCFFILKAMPC